MGRSGIAARKHRNRVYLDMGPGIVISHACSLSQGFLGRIQVHRGVGPHSSHTNELGSGAELEKDRRVVQGRRSTSNP